LPAGRNSFFPREGYRSIGFYLYNSFVVIIWGKLPHCTINAIEGQDIMRMAKTVINSISLRLCGFTRGRGVRGYVRIKMNGLGGFNRPKGDQMAKYRIFANILTALSSSSMLDNGR